MIDTQLTPEQIKDSLEFRIAEFDSMIIVKGGEGKFILTLEGNDESGYTLAMYASRLNKSYDKDHIGTHDCIRRRFDITTPIFGGANITYRDHTLTLQSFSTTFDGIPQEVSDSLVEQLREHLKTIDYNEEYGKVQEERHEHVVRRWKRKLAKIWDNYHGEKEEAERERKQRINELSSGWSGFWNIRAANKQGIPVEEYIEQKYAEELPQPPNEPEIPMGPERHYGRFLLKAEDIEVENRVDSFRTEIRYKQIGF